MQRFELRRMRQAKPGDRVVGINTLGGTEKIGILQEGNTNGKCRVKIGTQIFLYDRVGLCDEATRTTTTGPVRSIQPQPYQIFVTKATCTTATMPPATPSVPLDKDIDVEDVVICGFEDGKPAAYREATVADETIINDQRYFVLKEKGKGDETFKVAERHCHKKEQAKASIEVDDTVYVGTRGIVRALPQNGGEDGKYKVSVTGTSGLTEFSPSLIRLQDKGINLAGHWVFFMGKGIKEVFRLTNNEAGNYTYSQRDYSFGGLDASVDLAQSSKGVGYWEGQSRRLLMVHQKTQPHHLFIQFRNTRSENWGEERSCIRLQARCKEGDAASAYEENWRIYNSFGRLEKTNRKHEFSATQAEIIQDNEEIFTQEFLKEMAKHATEKERWQAEENHRIAEEQMRLRQEETRKAEDAESNRLKAEERRLKAEEDWLDKSIKAMQQAVDKWFFMENNVERQFELFSGNNGEICFKKDGSEERLRLCRECWQADVEDKTFLLKPNEKKLDVMIVDTPSVQDFQRAQVLQAPSEEKPKNLPCQQGYEGTIGTETIDAQQALESCIGEWVFQTETIHIAEKHGDLYCRCLGHEDRLRVDPAEGDWHLVELRGGTLIIRVKPSGTSLQVKMISYNSDPLIAERQKVRVGRKRCIAASVIMAIAVIIAIVIAATKKERIVLPDFPTTPSGACTAMQIHKGCAPNFCWPSGECRCEADFFQEGPRGCHQSMARHNMTFHMYALRGDEVQTPTYPVDALTPLDAEVGNLTYSLQGVLWYLHEKVITSSCPRKQHITRIVRFKATVHNPEHPGFQGQFGPFADYADGICKGAEGQRGHCGELYKKYGHGVGCLNWQPYMDGIPYGNLTHVYSLPGKEGANGRSSGWCASPTGGSTCTWHLEEAGEVTLNELEHIRNYGEFCARGGVEYDSRTDRGTGCSFWDDRKNSTANEARLAKLQNLFLKKFPDPEYAYGRPEPRCDARNTECKYNEHCKSQGLIGQCCPAASGRMLGCCSGPTVAERGFMM